jgi:radical SAM superfamily enzyme YgiQ (UPF0313 family)
MPPFTAHLVNPSDTAFGVAVITPRWLFVLASATPREFGEPRIWDETLVHMDISAVRPGDVVGIGIHTGNALRGYTVGRRIRDRGGIVVFGGIHPTLYPEESFEHGGAHAVVKGDGDLAWGEVLRDQAAGTLRRIYDGGRVPADQFRPARWDLLPPKSYMWASVQTVRGCPRHCSFCSVWRTDGQKPRQRGNDAVLEEIVELRRRGYRFIALADDNFYPVAKSDLALAQRQGNHERVEQLTAMRADRLHFMRRLKQLPRDMNFFTQMTIEAVEDPEFLDAMREARIRGALVGIEAVTAQGLKEVFKEFNPAGEELVRQLRTFREHGVHVLGSFIFGLPSDRAETFDATRKLAQEAGLTFAQFVTLTPFPGTVDFDRWEKNDPQAKEIVHGVPLSRYWLIPPDRRPKMFLPHPTMGSAEMRARTQKVWDDFYRLKEVWKRSACTPSLRSRLAFVLLSKLYRQMYANTGISTDSARRERATKWARMIAKPCLKLFTGAPMPELRLDPPQASPPLVQVTS